MRYRHTDSDLVRSARQQDFLRQAKQQITTSKLIDESERLMKIFGRNTSTDPELRSRSEVLRLLKLAVFSARQPIQEIHFEGTIGQSYVEASNEQMKKLVQQFLNLEDTPGPRGEAPQRRSEPKRRKRKRARPDAAALGLFDATALRRGPGPAGGAGRRRRLAAGDVPHAAAELAPSSPGAARLQAPRTGRHALRRLPHGHAQVQRQRRVLRPAGHHLAGPADPRRRLPETRKIGGREYELHYAGDRLRLVAWRTPKAAYWISNTLLQTLTDKQMLAIARSARRCC